MPEKIDPHERVEASSGHLEPDIQNEPSITPEAICEIESEPIPRPLQWLRENSLPLLGLLLIAFLVCFGVHLFSIKIDWTNTNHFTGSLQNIVQVLAFIAGGFWAYFKFIKGRTFQESLYRFRDP